MPQAHSPESRPCYCFWPKRRLDATLPAIFDVKIHACAITPTAAARDSALLRQRSGRACIDTVTADIGEVSSAEAAAAHADRFL